MTPAEVETLRALAADWLATAECAQASLREHTERENAKVHTLRDAAWKLQRALDKLAKEGA